MSRAKRDGGISVLKFQNWKGSRYHIDIDDSVITRAAVLWLDCCCMQCWTGDGHGV